MLTWLSPSSRATLTIKESVPAHYDQVSPNVVVLFGALVITARGQGRLALLADPNWL